MKIASRNILQRNIYKCKCKKCLSIPDEYRQSNLNFYPIFVLYDIKQ